MRARAPHLCRCPPHNTPQPPPEQRHQDTGADKQQPRTATWFFLSVQEKLQSHKVPWHHPSMCNDKYLPTACLQLLHLAMKFCTFLLFCFCGMYDIWSLLIWNAGHIILWENLCLYWEGKGWDSMTRTSTFMYGTFYSLVLCCTHIKKHSTYFITYFRTFPKTHARQTELVTFSLKKY